MIDLLGLFQKRSFVLSSEHENQNDATIGTLLDQLMLRTSIKDSMAVGRVKAAPSSFLLICLCLLFLLLRNQYIRTAKLHDHEEPEPAKFMRGTSKNFERKVKFLEYFFSPSRNKSVKNQRDPKPHISNINTVTFHFSHYED